METKVNKILVVGDGQLPKLIETVLRRYGYTEISQAESGGEGIKIAKTTGPNLVIVTGTEIFGEDSINGFDVISQIKQMALNTPIKILAMSGHFDVESRLRALGVDAFLQKPCDSKKLLEVVRDLLV